MGEVVYKSIKDRQHFLIAEVQPSLTENDTTLGSATYSSKDEDNFRVV